MRHCVFIHREQKLVSPSIWIHRFDTVPHNGNNSRSIRSGGECYCPNHKDQECRRHNTEVPFFSSSRRRKRQKNSQLFLSSSNPDRKKSTKATRGADGEEKKQLNAGVAFPTPGWYNTCVSNQHRHGGISFWTHWPGKDGKEQVEGVHREGEHQQKERAKKRKRNIWISERVVSLEHNIRLDVDCVWQLGFTTVSDSLCHLLWYHYSRHNPFAKGSSSALSLGDIRRHTKTNNSTTATGSIEEWRLPLDTDLCQHSTAQREWSKGWEEGYQAELFRINNQIGNSLISEQQTNGSLTTDAITEKNMSAENELLDSEHLRTTRWYKTEPLLEKPCETYCCLRHGGNNKYKPIALNKYNNYKKAYFLFLLLLLLLVGGPSMKKRRGCFLLHPSVICRCLFFLFWSYGDTWLTVGRQPSLRLATAMHWRKY